MAEANVGQGRVFVFGNELLFRTQPHGNLQVLLQRAVPLGGAGVEGSITQDASRIALLTVGDGIVPRSMPSPISKRQSPVARFLSLVLSLLVVYAAVRLFWFGALLRPIADSAFLEGLLKVIVWVPPSVGVDDGLGARVTARGLAPARPARASRAWVDVRRAGDHPDGAGRAIRGPSLPDFDDLVGTVLLGPFAEEVLFRGFLFTVLWRRVGWPWPIALAISAAAFGFAHVWRFDLWTPLVALAGGHPDHAYAIFTSQLRGLPTLAGIPAAAGLLFGWVFYRWGSLWPAIGLHAAMNFWWAVSHPGDKAFSWDVDLAGVAQAATMVMAMVLTLTRAKTKDR